VQSKLPFLLVFPQPISSPAQFKPRKENLRKYARRCIDLGASSGSVYITSLPLHPCLAPPTLFPLFPCLPPSGSPLFSSPPSACRGARILPLGDRLTLPGLHRFMRGKKWRCPRLLLLRRRRGSGCSATGRSVLVLAPHLIRYISIVALGWLPFRPDGSWCSGSWVLHASHACAFDLNGVAVFTWRPNARMFESHLDL
jgi:hypothetical protein